MISNPTKTANIKIVNAVTKIVICFFPFSFSHLRHNVTKKKIFFNFVFSWRVLSLHCKFIKLCYFSTIFFSSIRKVAPFDFGHPRPQPFGVPSFGIRPIRLSCRIVLAALSLCVIRASYKRTGCCILKTYLVSYFFVLIKNLGVNKLFYRQVVF